MNRRLNASATDSYFTRQRGVTLLELVTTMALVGILAFIAIPSFRSLVQNNQLASCSNKLIAAIQYAKSEAINTRQSIIVAPDASITDRPAFRVGLDGDGNNLVEDADLMQAFQCANDDIDIDNDKGVAFLRFGPSGFRTDGQGPVVFQTCNDIGSGKNLTVANSGSTSTADAPDGDC